MRMGARTRVQAVIGPGNLQFLKKDIGHIGIVMLTGMHQHFPALLAQHTGNSGSLDKLRSRANNGENGHIHRSFINLYGNVTLHCAG